MKIKIALIITSCAVLVLGGCMFFGQSTGTVSSNDQAAFQKVFMSSYYAERGGIPAGAKGLTPFLQVVPGNQGVGSKTTVPTNLLTDAHFATLAPKTWVNFPEPGQTTTFTISTQDAANHVYDITATTTFPSDDIRKNYVEEYYVIDGNPTYSLPPDGIWDMNDAIVRLSGGVWVQDQKSRVKQVLTFTDGTTRTETIVSQTGSGSNPTFNHFPVTDPLDFDQAFAPKTPATDLHVIFSSVVIYYVTPSVNTNYWFWQGTQAKTILGVRYYTETKVNNTPAGFNSYTVSFEKTINTMTTTGGSYTQTLQTVFAGSQFSTLAESVLRQQVTYDTNAGGNLILSTGQKITYMKTRVADVTSQKGFYLTQTNDDYVALSSDPANIYTPTGAVAEIVAGTPSAFVYQRNLQSSYGGQDLAVQSVGTGDLAVLYTSIQSGNGINPTGSTIPGSITPPGVEWTYNGAQGTSLPSSTVPSLGNTGTVEAWVYIDQQTDTGGIVHKGVAADFHDEAWSLQFWGNQGQVAWVIDQPGNNGNTYDLLTSTINLNTKKWYYIVATWDATAGPKYINLYINGTLNSSRLPSWAPNEADPLNNSAVLIGSQLPVQYNTTYGYFGFNGKINGVRVSATPMSAQTVATNYATYLPQTVNW